MSRQCSGVSFEPAARGAEAGVGEDDVDPPVAVQRALHEPLVVLEGGDVAAHGQRALGAAELLGQGLQLVLRARAEDDAVARRPPRRGRGGADAGGCAGDQKTGTRS
jgi:hypothetical protein